MEKDINWEIKQQGIADLQTGKVISGWKSITREKPNGEDVVFHIAKNSYNPPSIAEFKGYYNQLQKITGFRPEGFQTWNNGKLVFGYLRNTKNKFEIDGHYIEDYLLISVGFTGNNSFSVGSVNKLLRCQNEFGNINRMWSIKNTASRQIKTEELMDSFEQHIAVRNLMFESFNRFKNVKIDQKIINDCKRSLMEMEQGETVQDLGKIRANNYMQLSSAIANETAELGKNLWGLFNGVTKHTTWNLERNQSERNIFGNVVKGETRYKMNKNAYDFCNQYAENEKGILLPS